jgi:hypothetical protein
MKLKCIDGKTRNFEISKIDECTDQYIESKCLECGYLFGVHDTKILKEKFKKHICQKEIIN